MHSTDQAQHLLTGGGNVVDNDGDSLIDHPDDPGCVRVVITPQLARTPPTWTTSLFSAHS